MILIKKLSPPTALEALKKEAEERGLSDAEGYDQLRKPLKDQIRESLMREQGHLCAYCMRRIPDIRISEEDTNLSNIYIEHWTPRSKEPHPIHNRGLDYNNMLAVCSGNEKAPEADGRRKRRYFTCDKKREDAILTVNPLDENTLKTIYYEADGKIKSTDAKIDFDIDTKLNLNCSSGAVSLPQNRKAVLEAVQSEIVELGGDYRQNCIDQLHIWESETDSKTPYIGIAIWWLRDQIQAMQDNSI